MEIKAVPLASASISPGREDLRVNQPCQCRAARGPQAFPDVAPNPGDPELTARQMRRSLF